MRIRTENLSHERLLAVLDYNAKTGVFLWKQALSPRGLVGSVAGSVKPNGYRTIHIDGLPYLAHRLAWFYVNAAWPAKFLDHRDGQRDHNRYANLREAEFKLNNQNRRRANRNSKSGLLGAFPKGDKFEARIRTLTCTSKYLGTFNTAEEAHAAYVAAKRLIHEGCTL